MLQAAHAEEEAEGTPVHDESQSENAGEGEAVPGVDSPEVASAKARAAEQETNGAGKAESEKTEEEKAAEAAASAAKPGEKTAEEKATAARFAALSRERNEVENLKTTIRREKAEFANAQASHRAEVERAASELQGERSKLADAHARVEKILNDKDAFFEHVADRLGFKTADDLSKAVNGVWSKPRPIEQKIDPKDKPLTQAEFEALQAKAAEKSRLEAIIAKERADFDASFDAEEKGELVFEAAATIFSADERYQIAARIGAAARAAGEAVTVEDLADAVNEFAKSQKRWQRVLKRGSQASPAAGKPGTEKPVAGKPAPQANVTPARQASPGTKALANDTATERAAPTGKDGKQPSTYAERKAARKALIARLASS